MPDFYVFSTPESVSFGPKITLRFPAITSRIHFESALRASASSRFVPLAVPCRSHRPLPSILELWLKKTGRYRAKGQPQLQDRGGSGRSIASLQQLDRTPPRDQLLVRLGCRVSVPSGQRRETGRHQTG